MTTTKQKINALIAENPEAWLPSRRFDEAFFGIGRRHGLPAVAIYDIKKCVKIYMECGCSEDEAVESFEVYLVTGRHGINSPIYVKCFEDRENKNAENTID